MLKYRILHPQLLGALGRCGHGSRILIADSNYPQVTGAPAEAERVFLNLAPGLITATEVLKVLLEAVPVETAIIILTAENQEGPVVAEYRELLHQALALQGLPRVEHYEGVKTPDTCP